MASLRGLRRYGLTGLALVLACTVLAAVAVVSPAAAAVFSNATAINTTDPTCGGPPLASSPYPSNIAVAGLSGTVSDVNVTLNGLSNDWGGDLEVLLVGPAGGSQNLVLLSDAGTSVSGFNLTLDDSAPNFLPQNGALFSPAKPTDYAELSSTDSFPTPAPAIANRPGGVAGNNPPGAGTATLASVFNGISPNGTWSLYVVTDDCTDPAERLTGGWSLDITTAVGAATTTVVSSAPNPSTTGTLVTFTATVTSSGSPVTSGTVTFTEGATTLAANVALNLSGQASFTKSNFAEGNHIVTATYNGVAAFNTSSGSVNHRVNNATTASGSSYCNTGPITVNALPTAVATPYPSNIFLTGAPTHVVNVTATLKNVTHQFPDDMDVLLVGPAGQNLVLLSDAGLGTGPTFGADNVTVNFDDGAPGQLAQATPWGSAGSTVSSKPVDYTPLGNIDTFPSAPAPSASTALSTFNATNPNGTWSLYVVSDGAPDTGSIAGGWCLNFTFDTTPPAVSIVQAASQGDPTQHSPIIFTATFSEAVTGFSGDDVVISGTAGGTPVATVTGSGTTYEVKVAMTPTATSGTVIATIPAGRAFDPSGNGNIASSGGDNTVNWVLDSTKATCTYTIVRTPAPAHINFTVQDVGSGIASIAFPTLNNIQTPVPVPAFDVGTTSPVSFTATKANDALRAQIAVVITDVAGNQSSCV
jgi:hypothetical protein